MAAITQKSFYPKLLLRNYCLLAFFAGLITARFFIPGLAVLCLIILLSAAHGKRLAGALLLCLVFVLGVWFGMSRTPAQPPEPQWLVQSMGGDDALKRPESLYVQGKVKDVEIYADGRIRLLLSDILPLRALPELQKQYERHSLALRQSLMEAEPYSGNVAVTLWPPAKNGSAIAAPQAVILPLAGQTLRFNARFARVRGFANPGVFTIDEYWHHREVWIRGWNVGGKSAVPVTISGEPDFFTKLRHDLWESFVQALPGKGQGPSKPSFSFNSVTSAVSGIPDAASAYVAPAVFQSSAADASVPSDSLGRPVNADDFGDSMHQGSPQRPSHQKRGPSTEITHSLKTIEPLNIGEANFPQKTAEGPFIPSGLAKLQGTGAVFLPALIFGDRSGFTPYQKDLLAKATLTHSMALSGLHLGYIALVGIALALFISKFSPSILLFLPRPKLCFVITVPLALGYLWIGGAPLSLVRSAVMLFFFGLVVFGNRARALLDGLLAAVLLIVLLWPWALFDLSLQLSALSVGAIALFLPLIQHSAHTLIPTTGEGQNVSGEGYFWRTGGPTGFYIKSKMRAGVILLLMSLCIQITLAPWLVQVFGSIGLWFPLNLLWLPVLGLVVMPLTLGAFVCVCIGWGGGARLLLYGASLPCDALMWLLQRMDEAGYLVAPLATRPHWLTILGLWVVVILLPYIAWKKWQGLRAKERMTKTFYYAVAGCVAGAFLAVGVTALSWHRFATQDVSVALLDVGQGQSVVLSWPGGRVLVDGGGFPSKTFDVGKMVVAPYLTHHQPAKVDWLINSHPDYDHLGGMMYILESFTVTQGFAGNGAQMAGSLGEDYERITSHKARLRQQVWQAGDVIPLWAGGDKGKKPQYGDAVACLSDADNGFVTKNANNYTSANAHIYTDDKTDDYAKGLVLEVLWPPRGLFADSFMAAGTKTSAENAGGESESNGNTENRPVSMPAQERQPAERQPAGRNSAGRATAENRATENLGTDRHAIQSEAFEGLADKKQDDKRQAGGAKQKVYSGNDASLVLRLVWQGKGLALLCGDLGKKGLSGLLKTTAPEALRAEVLILPHHGSKSSFSKRLYETVNPSTVLVSCGYKNVWGFPHVDVRNTLHEMRKPLFSTAEYGMVKVRWPKEAGSGEIELTRP